MATESVYIVIEEVIIQVQYLIPLNQRHKKYNTFRSKMSNLTPIMVLGTSIVMLGTSS